MKMSSAYANKLVKSLTDEKSYWENKEMQIALDRYNQTFLFEVDL